MAIKKIITVDGIEVPFKASATLPRLYRAKFRKDIFKDFAALKDSVDESDEENSGLGIPVSRKPQPVARHRFHVVRIPVYSSGDVCVYVR